MKEVIEKLRNIKRYGIDISIQMQDWYVTEDCRGEWIKFEDIEELIKGLND